MEKDVRLVQQLLALGDSIQELKRDRIQSGSQSSLNSSECDDEYENLCPTSKPYSYNSQLANTNVFLDDPDDDEPPNNQQQTTDLYFSRKHSILRIPIAPRSSNRKCSIQKITRRASEIRCSRPHHPRLDSTEADILKCNIPTKLAPSSSSSARASTGSIDSGIRDTESASLTCSSPSPTFKDQKF